MIIETTTRQSEPTARRPIQQPNPKATYIMPPWIPQNIQKRLLLYVLQQLSLFSEIDLPNLEEVSMNSIVLKDVLIDPEKVGKLPGCNLRYGQVGTFELSTTASESASKGKSPTRTPPKTPKSPIIPSVANNGGVFIDAHDVEIVISPDFDVNEDISTSVQFLLAQSTANLANTIMLDDDSTDDDLDDLEAPPKSTTSAKPTSTLSGVMARAVEMALLRLQVNIHNFKIKIVTEMTDLILEIDQLIFTTVNGIRHVELHGVRLITLKPLVNPGEKTKKSEQKTTSDSESEVDYSDDELDESLMDSMLFTHDEASSIYMSATSKSFQQSAFSATPAFAPPHVPPTILHIDRVNIDFKGLSTISNLKIDVGDVKMAMAPLTPTLIAILDGITRSVKIKNYQKRKEKSRPHNSRFPEYNGDDDVGEDEPLDSLDEPMFSKLHIDNIVISATSALSPSGTFESTNTLNLVLNNVNVKQKNLELVYGGVENFTVVRQEEDKSVGVFDFIGEDFVKDPKSSENDLSEKEVSNSSGSSIKEKELEDKNQEDKPGSGDKKSKADIRFEMFTKDKSEFTVLCSKEANILLDAKTISTLIILFGNIDLMYTSWATLEAALEAKKKKTSLQFLLQTATIKVSTVLNPSTSLNATISPILFNLLRDEMKISQILVTCKNPQREFTIIVVSHIKLTTKLLEFRTFLQSGTTSNSNSLPREVSMISSTSLVITKIVIGVDLVDAGIIIRGLSDVLLRLTVAPSASQKIDTRRKRPGLNSTCSFRLFIKYVEVNINQTPLGTFTSSIYDICVKQMGQEVIGLVFCLDIARRAEEVVKVVYEYTGKSYETMESPIVFMKLGNGIMDITVRGLLLEYYGKWLTEIQDLETENTTGDVPEAPMNPTSSSGSKLDIRITFFDCIFGATPIALPSKVYVVIDRCNTDLTFTSSKLYVKSLVRNLAAYLIDDVLNTKHPETHRRHFRGVPQYTPPTTYYSLLGYIRIGKINNFHVGVTFELKSIDIKVNSDEQQVELCADSMQCVVSLAADLKLPVTFEDDEKMRVRLPLDLNLLDDLNSHEFEWNEEIEDPEISAVESVDDQLYVESLSANSLGSEETISFREDHFNEKLLVILSFPVTVNVNLSKTKIYFYDGYDWEETRKTIREAVSRLEERVRKRKSTKNGANNEEPNEDSESPEEHVDLVDSLDLGSLEIDSIGSSDIEENLFQSIYLGVPSTYKTGLREAINTKVNLDTRHTRLNLDTTNIAHMDTRYSKTTEEADESPKKHSNINVNPQKSKHLNLNRSTQCKSHIEIKNVELNVAINASGTVLNSVEVSVETFNIYDNLLTSSWHKLLSCGGEKREIGTQMLKLSLVNVRPDEGVIMGEAVVRLTIMPLRLYIDQDMVEFLTRFFGFKDDRFTLEREEEDIYFEKFQMDELKLCIDYKPKLVDYTGIRGGKYAELLNFFSLEGSEIKLDAVTVFGQRGVPNLLEKLGSLWGQSFSKSKNSKILKVLIGLSMFRLIYNIGGNLRDLVVVLLTTKEDKLKAVQKQSVKFFKSVGYEAVRMGVKLSTGAQILLEQGEEYLEPKLRAQTKRPTKPKPHKLPKQTTKQPKKKTILESSKFMSALVFAPAPDQFGNSKLYLYVDLDEEEDEEFLKSVFQDELPELDEVDDFAEFDEAVAPVIKPVSLYLNQPANMQQGVEYAYKSINKNIKQTQRRVLQLIEELEDADSLGETFKVLLQGTPHVVIRPIIGTTEAISKTLMGLGNNIDSQYLRESRDKYLHDSESE